MAIRIIHAKVSGKAAGADATRVYGTHWDADHTVTGLENVDNTSDANKPVSTATQTALDAKQNIITIASGKVLGNFSGSSAVPTAQSAREFLSGSRTYYVRTDGSNSNTGLSNTAGAAFLTIQKAYDVVAGTLDLAGQSVTIQVADGTYTGGLLIAQPWTGGGSVTLVGNNATPANVVISTTSADAVGVTAPLPGAFLVKDLKVQTATSGNGLSNAAAGAMSFQNVVFGACASMHLICSVGGAKILATGNYAVTGAAQYHWTVGGAGSVIVTTGRTITFTGALAFTAFALASTLSAIQCDGMTFTGGTITGSRYSAQLNGVIFTGGGGATYLPGNAIGTTATGGQYA